MSSGYSSSSRKTRSMFNRFKFSLPSIHPWEIDPGQPRVAGIMATNWFRQRFNLRRCEERLAALVDAFEWMPLCDLMNGWNAACGTAQLGRCLS
jgi:hypothetical protein